MGYFFDYSKDSYKPDRKDLNIARRLQGLNPMASQDQLYSQQGRMFIARNPGKTNRKGGRSIATFERYFPGGYQKPVAAPPAPAPAPAAPAPKPAPKPTQNTQFSEAAAALLKTAEASLAAINKPAAPAEKMKILQTGSIDVGAAPLQINAAAPPPKTSGVDSFKRKKPASNPMKILTQNSLNI